MYFIWIITVQGMDKINTTPYDNDQYQFSEVHIMFSLLQKCIRGVDFTCNIVATLFVYSV